MVFLLVYGAVTYGLTSGPMTYGGTPRRWFASTDCRWTLFSLGWPEGVRQGTARLVRRAGYGTMLGVPRVYSGVRLSEGYRPTMDGQVVSSAKRTPPSELVVEGPSDSSVLGDALARAQNSCPMPTGTPATTLRSVNNGQNTKRRTTGSSCR